MSHVAHCIDNDLEGLQGILKARCTMVGVYQQVGTYAFDEACRIITTTNVVQRNLASTLMEKHTLYVVIKRPADESADQRNLIFLLSY